MSPYETQLSKDLKKKTYLFFLTETEPSKHFEIVFESYRRPAYRLLRIHQSEEKMKKGGGEEELHSFYPAFIYYALPLCSPYPPIFQCQLRPW